MLYLIYTPFYVLHSMIQVIQYERINCVGNESVNGSNLKKILRKRYNSPCVDWSLIQELNNTLFYNSLAKCQVHYNQKRHE